mmetsp:Transcript_16349/g.37338  ORF Transcript_16349/g.37338 Transcript_16349/m.37338 type:complete len:81 (+) Transcript_16349:439-681(+)
MEATETAEGVQDHTCMLFVDLLWRKFAYDGGEEEEEREMVKVGAGTGVEERGGCLSKECMVWEPLRSGAEMEEEKRVFEL